MGIQLLPHSAVEQLGGVVFDVAYDFRDLEGFHCVGREGTQQVERRTGRIGVAVKPAVEVTQVQDDGHSVVDRAIAGRSRGSDKDPIAVTLGVSGRFESHPLRLLSISYSERCPSIA